MNAFHWRKYEMTASVITPRAEKHNLLRQNAYYVTIHHALITEILLFTV